MTKLVTNPIVRSELSAPTGSVELCDEAGQTYGYFVPPELYKKLWYAWLNTQVDEEEIQRRLQEPAGRTLAEIWKDLGQE